MKILLKKLSKNDQMFVNINTKLDGLTLSVRDQLAFDKKIELKVAQLLPLKLLFLLILWKM